MGRKKLEKRDLKVTLSIRMNSKLLEIVNESIDNKSKYIEWLVTEDLNRNNKLNKN